MMSLTLVSQNIQLRQRIEQICIEKNINILKLFDNSKSALEFFGCNKTDYVVIDFLLNSFDSLEVLRIACNNFGLKCLFVAPKHFDTIIKKAIDFGAFNVLDYDFCSEDFEKFLLNTKKDAQESFFDVDELVSKLCIEIGITPYLNGYKYLKEAIFLTIKEPEKYKFVTKTLYPKIAEKFNSSPDRVERSIRHAINTANNTEKILNLNNFLNVCMIRKGDRLTNGQFIALVSDRVLYRLNVEKMKNYIIN